MSTCHNIQLSLFLRYVIIVSQFNVNQDICMVSQILKGMTSIEYYSFINGVGVAVICR